MFWKKVNRGLLLGAALLIFLIGYIVVQEVQFDREKPVIEDQCESYLTDLLDLQCNLQGEVGQVLPAATVAAQKDKMNRVLKAYWYGELPQDEYSGYGVNDVRLFYNKYLEQKVSILLSSAEVQLKGDRVSIKKDGPNRATVKLSVDVKIRYAGKSGDFFYGYFMDYAADNEFDNGSQSNAQAEEPSYTDDTVFFNMVFELYRVKGEWKIVSFTPGNYYW
ncbi:MAG: hypothetical protein IJR88_04600 [Clostridia bacterium]|nr:hypothetical protein [Clostridia bacterium]